MHKSTIVSRADTDFVACDSATMQTASELTATILDFATHLNNACSNKRTAINICSERLNFIQAFFGVIAAQHTNLLPANKQPATLADLIQQYPHSYILHDGASELIDDLTIDVPTIDVRQFKASDDNNTASPACTLTSIPDEHISSVSFTSGSTGVSTAIAKPWSALRLGAQINARNMLIGAPKRLHMLATVPPQHMYGLELSVMLPMVADVCIHNGQPLLPSDIRIALAKLPEPRALVSTPAHLKALVNSDLEFPAVARIYCATAPLEQAMATSVEAMFNGEIVEIYGCSEVGSIARRRTSVDISWTPFDAMNLTHHADSGLSTVSAPHVPEPVALQDTLRPTAHNGFTLHGRLGDMINIAGIRGSLTQINQHLLSIDGVIDGIAFMPDHAADSSSGVQRLAAIVVSDKLDRRSVREALKPCVHPAFMPRPILFTDALPRNESSKLPRADVLRLFEQLLKS